MASNNIQYSTEIDQSDEILQLLNDICMSDEHADVKLIVENTKIPAHKAILSARSEYFRSLFGIHFAEGKKDEIELKVPLNAFQSILKYIYTGRLSLASLESDQVIEIYDLAEQYGFDTLKKVILKHLTDTITLDNCGSILNAAHLYSLDDLQTVCLQFLDGYSIDFLDHDSLKELSLDSLCALLKRDKFYASEIDIFKAVCNWATGNPGTDVKTALSAVRWSKLSMTDYMNVVEPSKLLNPTEIFQVMKASQESVSGEGEEENFATIEHGARVITGSSNGSSPSVILREKFTDYNLCVDCTYHRISDSSGITVDLGKLRFINNIIFLLTDKKDCSYSYYVDVSADGEEYIRLFDHRNHYYRSWQYLYFPTRPVRFIRLVGTNAYNVSDTQSSRVLDIFIRTFDIVGFKAIYRAINYPEFIDGALKPMKNIAKAEFGVQVEGGGGNNMLNEYPDEFTCHEKDRYILLQFNQPYHIGSLRMLLGNKMNHPNKYSFYIETSMDKQTWTMAVDKRDELLSGWQEFDFETRPAIFIKLTGTQRDINFVCTYFECPRNPQKPKLKRPTE